MTFIPAAFAAIGSFVATNGLAIASAVAGIGSFVGSQTAAANQQFAANGAAMNLDNQAKAERAKSHMEAARRQRADKALLSTQQNSMANSGFEPDEAIIGATHEEMTLQGLLELATAEQEAQRLEYAAKQTRMQGKFDASATRMSGYASAAGNVASWGDQYGMLFRSSGSGSGGTIPTKKARTG